MPNLSEYIRDAQNGDASALEKLILQFSGTIRRECTRYSLNLPPDLSHSDLVQEVLLRVWTKIGQFKGVEQEETQALVFECWIIKNARSTLHNLIRDRGAQKRMPAEGITSFDEVAQEYHKHQDNQSGPSSILAKDEEAERLKVAMNRYLDDREREILIRYIVEGQTFKQISEDMSLSYDQVRYAFHTAHTGLANWLV